MKILDVTTYTATIFIAGNLSDALSICQEHCDAIGLCVTVDPTTYVYTGGREDGVRVGLINYPRFASAPEEIFTRACTLAVILLDGLNQMSVSVVATDRTRWFSRRAEDVAA